MAQTSKPVGLEGTAREDQTVLASKDGTAWGTGLRKGSFAFTLKT